MGCCQSIIFYPSADQQKQYTDDDHSPAILKNSAPSVEAGELQFQFTAEEIKEEVQNRKSRISGKRSSGSNGGEAVKGIVSIPSVESPKAVRIHKRSESFDRTNSRSFILVRPRKSFGSSPNGGDGVFEIKKLVPDLDPESQMKLKERSERRKSFKSTIEEKTVRGEDFWKNMLPQPKSNNEVVTSRAAEEAEDSKQEIGFVNQYTFINQLGEGASGEVKLAMNESDQKLYAIKIMSRKSQNKKVALSRSGNHRLSIVNGIPQEVAMLKKLTHPNMVNLYEVIDDPRIDRLYLVFEYVPGKQFASSSEMEPLPIEKCKRYFIDVAKALLYCHEQGVCHGDIKPENLLITPDDQIKISDFGVSYMISDAISKKRAGMGTPLFTAPEVLLPEKTKFLPQPLDVWALGITLYVFVFGKCPFIGETVLEVHEKIKSQMVQFPANIDPKLEDLISQMLQKDPNERIKLSDALNHPWLHEEENIQEKDSFPINQPTSGAILVMAEC